MLRFPLITLLMEDYSLPPVPWPKFFRAQVGASRNARQAINALRHRLGSGDPRTVFAELRGNTLFRQSVAVSPQPRTFAALWNFLRLTARGLIADFRWTTEVVALHADVLVDFLAIERQFDHSYIAGDWQHCLGLLDQLENRHGLSIWLISRRLTLQRRVSPAQEEDYAARLIASASDGSVMGWLTYLMSFRADPNVTPTTFLQTIERALKNAGAPPTYRDFLRYHLTSAPPRDPDGAAHVLSMSETGAVIDRYLALLDIAQFVTSHFDPTAPERAIVAECADRLATLLPDDRLTLLGQVNTVARQGELVARLRTEDADLYTEGRYTEAVTVLSDYLAKHPDGTSLYSLLARALLRDETPTGLTEPACEVIHAMSQVQVFSEEQDTGLARLMRESQSGAHRALSASIRALVIDRSGDPSEPSLDAAIEALNGSAFSPLQLRNLPVADRRALIDRARAAHPASVALELQAAVLDFGNSTLDESLRERLPPERAALYSARALLRLSRLDEAVALLEKLVDHEVVSVANDARRELYRAFVAAGQLREALRLVAQAYKHNERLPAIFQLAPLLDAIEQSDDGVPFDEIALSICYHILNRFGGDQRLGAQADAAEEFVLSRGVALPSELELSHIAWDSTLLPIYLDQVCAPATLDKFMALESVDQVEVERLSICRILAEIDPGERQRYQEEIREITRRRVVRDRFEQVERTKIYVDTDGVKRQAEKTLRDTYQRFAAASHDESNASERLDVVKMVQQLLADVKTDGIRIHFTDLPANEGDQIFDRLVHEVMRLLVSSQEYGLEAYLSTRVRHGTMGNQLRSAYELQSLLTQRDNGQYSPDRHWPDTLGLESYIGGDWLAERLANFSADLDNLIEDLVRKRVQVRSESTPDGLFVFQAFNYDTASLQAEITPETSFDTFIDKVVEQFWGILETTLVNVRRYIEGEFTTAVQMLTEELEKDVGRELASVPINILPLRDAIAAARTQMLVNVTNVASWFTLARDMERPDYEFGIAVEVATQSIRVCHPSLDVTLHRSDEVSFDCRGKTLESLVYILFTALDNALAHCGFHDHAPDLTLETSLEDNWLELRLVNSCAPVADVDCENDRLTQLRQRLEEGTEAQLLATIEGGTGYAKIIRILRHDLLARHTLEFGYRSATEYAVTIGMEAKAMVK